MNAAAHTRTGQTWLRLAEGGADASPELLRDEGYGPAIDLWGLGHIMYASLTGRCPFDESMDMYGDVTSAKVVYSHATFVSSPRAQALCMTLLCADPKARPSPKAVLSHAWVAASIAQDKLVNLSLRYLGYFASLRGVCLRVLESLMPTEYREELELQFNALDSDAKGYLNATDVRRALKRRERRGKDARRSSEDRRSGGRSSWASAETSEEDQPSSIAHSASAKSSLAETERPAAQLVDVSALLRRLLANALQGAGVGQKHAKARGNRESLRAAHGARRVGVVSYSMFAEAALEGNPALVRKLWEEGFRRMDADEDGVIGDTDLAACLSGLGVEMTADARHGLLQDAGGATSKVLLRAVLKAQVV